jgi:hypothetical protein
MVAYEMTQLLHVMDKGDHNYPENIKHVHKKVNCVGD